MARSEDSASGRSRRRVALFGVVVLVVAAWRTRVLERLARLVVPHIADRAWDVPLTAVLMGRGWERRTAVFASYDMEPGDVVMLGDSITEMADWPVLLPGVRVHNQGIGGDVTEGVMRRLELVTKSAPGKVFLMIGTNDIGRGDVTVEQIVDNVATIVERIRADSPTTKVYVQSVLPRLRRRADQVRLLNDGIQRVARDQGVEWIDLWPMFDRGDGQMRDQLAIDALHPSAEGYRQWVSVIAPLVADE